MHRRSRLVLALCALAAGLMACRSPEPQTIPMGILPPTIEAGNPEDSQSSPAVDGNVTSTQPAFVASYAIVDTGQTQCYDVSGSHTACPVAGEASFGQDAQYSGNVPSYTDNGDGTVTDNVTGLMWQQSPDADGDGDIDAADKMTYEKALAQVGRFRLAGYDDWRLPTIKELYSLIDFSGLDPSGYEGADPSGLVPFIDTTCFDFGYGDTGAGERLMTLSSPLAQNTSAPLWGATTPCSG